MKHAHLIRPLGWAFAAILLVLPAIAMQFTDEVQWTASDFLFAAVMIGFTGLGLELLARARSGWWWNAGSALLGLGLFALTWANLAVGFVAGEDQPINLAYLLLVPLVVGIAAISRLSARGMVIAAGAVAAAMPLLAGAALALGLHRLPGEGVMKIVAPHLAFGIIFLLSALAFAKAWRDVSRPA